MPSGVGQAQPVPLRAVISPSAEEQSRPRQPGTNPACSPSLLCFLLSSSWTCFVLPSLEARGRAAALGHSMQESGSRTKAPCSQGEPCVRAASSTSTEDLGTKPGSSFPYTVPRDGTDWTSSVVVPVLDCSSLQVLPHCMHRAVEVQTNRLMTVGMLNGEKARLQLRENKTAAEVGSFCGSSQACTGVKAVSWVSHPALNIS